jgi:hypothetical protein
MAVVGDIAAAEQLLVVCRVVLLVEASRETKVGQLDVSRLVDEDVVWLDITVDEAEVVDGLNSEDALCHVELGDVLGEGVVLDQPARSETRSLNCLLT